MTTFKVFTYFFAGLWYTKPFISHHHSHTVYTKPTYLIGGFLVSPNQAVKPYVVAKI